MKSQHFSIKELVPPDILEQKGEDWCWQRLNPDMLRFLDQFWEDAQQTWGSTNTKVAITLNDWSWGGRFSLRGWRPADAPVGAKHSYHKDGNAVDVVLHRVDIHTRKREQIAPIDVNAYVMDSKASGKREYQWVRCFESGDRMTWSHFDGRNFDGVLEINA